MLTIWGRANSSNVKKVLWCAEELDLAYDRREAGGAFGVVDTAEYRRLNPTGLVPTIEDGGFVLWESNAIVRYLAATYGRDLLWLEDPRHRGHADRWMDWSSTAFVPVFTPIFRGLVRTPPEQRDRAAIEAAVAAAGRLLAIPEAALAEWPYLSGDGLGIGDIPLGVLIHGWFNLPIERPATPHLARWYALLKERPAYARVVATALS